MEVGEEEGEWETSGAQRRSFLPRFVPASLDGATSRFAMREALLGSTWVASSAPALATVVRRRVCASDCAAMCGPLRCEPCLVRPLDLINDQRHDRAYCCSLKGGFSFDLP